MNWKSEKKRQLIFLALIISGTLILYSSEIFRSKNNNLDLTQPQSSTIENYINGNAGKLFGIFLKNPGSKEGIDALFYSIVSWDRSGNDSLIQSAIIAFEKYVKNDSLKDKFYTRLGKYFVEVKRKSPTSVIGEIMGNQSASLKVRM